MFYRPENSLAAFEHTISLGVGWAECDIRLSRDLTPVLHHDEAIPLPTGDAKAIRELDYRRLGEIDIGGGETVPTLKTLLKRFGKQLQFDLEIKELDAVERIVQLVLEMDLADRVILSSFIPEALQTAQDIAPVIPRGLLVDRLTGRIVGGKSAVKAALMLGCDYLLPHYKALSAHWVTDAQSEGMKVMPWTVNRMDEAKALIEMGVDGLISDRPDQFFPLIAAI